MTGTIPQTDCLFQQPWWLDAVAPGSWDAVTVEEGGRIAARLPYAIVRRLGLTLIATPKLTQCLGPWIEPSEARYAKRLARERDLMHALIEGLPKGHLFWQNFHYSRTNWLPFYWKGFSQTTRYTYVLDDLSDPERVMASFQDKTRYEVRKALKKVSVRTDLGLDRFLELNAMTYRRQGRDLPYSTDLVRRLDAACDERSARRMFFAEDADGRCHAALYLVWDERSAYYLMSGADPELRSSGAGSLLLWEAIQFAAGVSAKFDFEGSMIEPVERVARSMGAEQRPYSLIYKPGRMMRVLLAGREAVRALGAGHDRPS